MQFDDSIDANMELLRQILGGMTAGQRERAKRVAIKIEKVVQAIQKDNQQDAAAGMGLAFAVMYIAQNMVRNNSVGEDGPRIQLLS